MRGVSIFAFKLRSTIKQEYLGDLNFWLHLLSCCMKTQAVDMGSERVVLHIEKPTQKAYSSIWRSWTCLSPGQDI